MSAPAAFLLGASAWHPDCWLAGGRPAGATYDAAKARWPRGKACAFCGSSSPAPRAAAIEPEVLAFVVARLPDGTTPEQAMGAVMDRALAAGHSRTTAATWAAAAGALFARIQAAGEQLPPAPKATQTDVLLSVDESARLT